MGGGGGGGGGGGEVSKPCFQILVIISVNKLLSDRYLQLSLKYLLLILSGDIELNPGPQFLSHNLSVLHVNIRSIRHKLEYI